ncbi:primase-helicase family protein [Aureimonas ureilytica]|uniref:primase-helicase family protein n=1 Tax=Aureimonas ureilytica TaxID=401562 RepID=UPI00035CC938|nr:primase-helicase family protein [Aureimonas ureilytica]
MAEGEDASVLDPVQIVHDFLAKRGVEILFDGSLRLVAATTMALTPADIAAVLDRDDVDHLWLLDEILLELRGKGIRMPKGDMERALRKVTRQSQGRRRRLIAEAILEPLSQEGRSEAGADWTRLAQGIFDAQPEVAAACLQHFIWQVKQKLLGRPVKHHLMPVVFSRAQGSGKTTFVSRFLSPLRELATSPVLLSDFADPRSGDVYRFPAVFIDDVEKVPAPLVPVLKSVITGESLRRRKIGSSMSYALRQRATLIGTANNRIEELVADDTGNRRFVTLPFRNGEAGKNGDPLVWPIVMGTDYGRLWRFVDAFAPSPIEAQLGALFALQRRERPQTSVEVWLAALDVASEAVARITTKEGVRATPLWNLFLEQTGASISQTKFGGEMALHAADPTMPFTAKVHRVTGTFYPLRIKTDPAPHH